MIRVCVCVCKCVSFAAAVRGAPLLLSVSYTVVGLWMGTAFWSSTWPLSCSDSRFGTALFSRGYDQSLRSLFFFPPFPFPFRFRFRFRLIDKCSKSFWLHYDIQRYDVVEWFLHWRVLYISYYTNRLAFVDAIKLKPAEVYFLYSFILFLNALHFPFVRNPWIGMNVGKKKTRDGTNLTAIRLDQIHISLFWECF